MDLKESDCDILTPSLRILGHITASGNDEYTSLLVDIGLIRVVSKYLNHGSYFFRKEICWIVGNIVCTDKRNTNLVMKEETIYDNLRKIAISDSQIVRHEALYAFANLASRAGMILTRDLLEKKIIATLCFGLKHFPQKSRLLWFTLQGLENLFSVANHFDEDENVAVSRFHELGGCEDLEKLQFHTEKKIFELVN